jgi:cephalosporin hydroxylase
MDLVQQEFKNKIVKILESKNLNGFNNLGGTDKATDHSYDVYYSEIFEEYYDKEITLLEIGIQYGGSAVLWNDLFPKSKLVLIDNVNIVHPLIWDYLDKDRYEFLVEDAFNVSTIEKLQTTYPSGFDIIIEDGPHTLDSQIFAIKHYSKLLKENGVLIIEDIQNYEYCEIIMNQIDKNLYSSVEVIDLRKNKNRYDDILIVIKK